MSLTISVPRYAVYSAQRKLARAEAVVDSFCQLYDAATRLFTQRIPAARDNDALKIGRAWLRASA